jgi:hypothetical protein
VKERLDKKKEERVERREDIKDFFENPIKPLEAKNEIVNGLQRRYNMDLAEIILDSMSLPLFLCIACRVMYLTKCSCKLATLMIFIIIILTIDFVTAFVES